MSSMRLLAAASRLARTRGRNCLCSSAVPSQTALPINRTTCLANTSSTARTFSAMSAWRDKYYTESHEWIELDGDKKTGTVGITAHAASMLGDIVFVELPEADAELKGGDSMGAVESVKSASDLYAPVSGTIRETNKKLEETPGLINKSPEAEGWIARIELADGEGEKVLELMSEEDYKKFSA